MIVCPHCGVENSPLAGETLKTCLACRRSLTAVSLSLSDVLFGVVGCTVLSVVYIARLVLTTIYGIAVGFGILAGFGIIAMAETVFEELVGVVIVSGSVQIALLSIIVGQLIFLKSRMEEEQR